MKHILTSGLVVFIFALYCAPGVAHQGHHHPLGEVHSHMTVESSLLALLAIIVTYLIAKKK